MLKASPELLSLCLSKCKVFFAEQGRYDLKGKGCFCTFKEHLCKKVKMRGMSTTFSFWLDFFYVMGSQALVQAP